MNIGILGYGMMGRHHAAVWSEIPGIRIMAIAEPDPSIQDRIRADGHKCRIYHQSHFMLQRESLDAVIVATHAPLHFAHVMDALNYGFHVVCEKPMATTLQECDQMVAKAKQRGKVLAIHHQSVFARAVSEAKRQIMRKQIGDLMYMQAYGKGRIAASDLMEIGGHLVHAMRHISGAEVTEVYGNVTMQGRDITKDDATQVINLYPEGRDSGIGAGDRMTGFYKFSNGIRGELHLWKVENSPGTFNDPRSFGYCIEIFGTKARLKLVLPRYLFLNEFPLDSQLEGAVKWTKIDPEYDKDRDSVLTAVFARDFLQASKTDQKPYVSGEDGRMAMEMTLGIYASHLAGKPLSIPLENRRHPLER